MCRICSVLMLFSIMNASSFGEVGRTQKSVVYSESSGNRNQTSLDVFAPATGSDLPVIVWIHGGGWQKGDKRGAELKAKAFNEKGFVLVSINYRLHPATDYQGQGADVAKAIKWVHDHASEFGGSSQNIFVMGHSAGAHLAALVSTDERYLKAEGLGLANIKGVILLDGAAYDIPRQIDLAVLPRLREMYSTVFTSDEKKQKDASPISHVAKGKGIPPFLILHIASRRDGKAQSESLANELKEAEVVAEVISESDKTHATINRELGTPGDIPTKHVFDFLDQTLKASKKVR